MDNELLIMILFTITFLIIYKYIIIEKKNESFKTVNKYETLDNNTINTDNNINFKNNNTVEKDDNTEEELPINLPEHPKNSKDFIKHINFKDAIKNGKTLSDSYKLMVGDIQPEISNEELDRIQGKNIDIDTNQYKNLFNPAYINFDHKYFNNMLEQPKTDYNIIPYNNIPSGSAL